MNHHRLRNAFAILHYTLGLVVFAQSVTTAVEAAGGGAGTGRNPLFALAAVEAVAAILFVIPRTVRIGGGLLLGVFPVAIAVHALRGDLALTLVVYGAAVVFVMAHGPVVGVRALEVPREPSN